MRVSNVIQRRTAPLIANICNLISPYLALYLRETFWLTMLYFIKSTIPDHKNLQFIYLTNYHACNIKKNLSKPLDFKGNALWQSNVIYSSHSVDKIYLCYK